MLSTKSRLLTRLPGAKKRISIDFSSMNPGTAGQTIGPEQQAKRNIPPASACVEVNGSRNNSRGGCKRQLQQPRKNVFGTASLSSGMGKSAFGHVKNALRRAAVIRRIMQHALAQAIGTA